jgi:HAD superfamily hydrolase (TIGR01490 family)
MNRKIAFFDFDGTITTKDTLLEVIKYQKGRTRFYWGFLLHAPLLLAYKLKLISNQKAKERMLQHFFGGCNVDDFQQQCDAFAQHKLPTFIRKKALHEIIRLKKLGVEVVIVSASAENWLRLWCQQRQVQLIGTCLQKQHNKITGIIDGKNCYGEEKVNRIHQQFQLDNYKAIYCYGDTSGDLPMLKLGTVSFYKPFR